MTAIKEIKTDRRMETVHPHILVMEDDLSVARGLKMILDEQGYDVDLEGTGAGALEAIGRYDYDLLMADLRLPDIDGMQVVKRLREMKPQTEVIVMTGYATSALAVQSMKLGARDFIAKPFTEDQIRTAIENALKKDAREKMVLREGRSSTYNTSIQKREVIRVLNRTAEDEKFWVRLMEKGSEALNEYALSAAAKIAVASGDLRWIHENIGELTQKQLMFIYKRLEREAW